MSPRRGEGGLHLSLPTISSLTKDAHKTHTLTQNHTPQGQSGIQLVRLMLMALAHHRKHKKALAVRFHSFTLAVRLCARVCMHAHMLVLCSVSILMASRPALF